MIFPSPRRKRLNSAQRQELYEAEKQKAVAAGLGEFPICALCGLSILPGQQWHDNHGKYLPHAIGGHRDGISHARCNRKHNNEVATPQVAKFRRIVKKHLDIHRTRTPLPGGRDDDRYRKLSGEVVFRATGKRA